MKSPNGSDSTGDLHAVAALSSRRLWAVGDDNSGRALVERWNGQKWTVVASPTGGGVTTLYGVAGSAPNDVWSVGGDSRGALIEHWNAHRWSIVKAPGGGDGAVLDGVAVLSAKDAWAVGQRNEIDTLIEHWNGFKWSMTQAPTGESGSGGLSAVAADGPSDVWAVGTNDYTGKALIDHWNGVKWSTVHNPAGAGTSLEGVTAPSADDVWAVGEDAYSGDAVVLHWKGARWSVVPSLRSSNAPGDLHSVAAVEGQSWAVGEDDGPLVDHWNGVAWVRDFIPNASHGNSILEGVSAISSTNIWAVGVRYPGGHTLIEHKS